MDTSETYVKMSWQAREDIKEAWKQIFPKQRIGTLICFRSFIGMIVNVEHKKLEGLASIIPETMALRTWCDPENEDLHIIEIGCDFDDEGFPLLRQDQIQEMMWGEFKSIPQAGLKILFEDIHYSHDKKMAEYYSQFNSFEQLWLAFYMHEKHNKIWDGEKWITK